MGVLRGDRALSPYTTMVGAEALVAATCEPGASSTDPMILSMLLSEAADLGHHLFSLFLHPASAPPYPPPPPPAIFFHAQWPSVVLLDVLCHHVEELATIYCAVSKDRAETCM